MPTPLLRASIRTRADVSRAEAAAVGDRARHERHADRLHRVRVDGVGARADVARADAARVAHGARDEREGAAAWWSGR